MSIPDTRGWLFDHSRGQILHMLQLLNAEGPPPGRTVVFLSPGPSAGTTSVAWAYARAVAELSDQRVLVLDASGAPPPRAAQAGAVEGTAEGTPIVEGALVRGPRVAVQPSKAAMNVYTSRLMSDDECGHDVLATVAGPDFWCDLREHFDEVVIDCPAVSRSHLGIVMAPRADAVVLVIEADRTRAPVAEKVLRDLRAMNANVVGTVLNRRRYYVPTKIYERL